MNLSSLPTVLAAVAFHCSLLSAQSHAVQSASSPQSNPSTRAVVGQPAGALPAQSSAADRILAQASLKPYHGWIKYLVFQRDVAALRPGGDRAAAAARLDDWCARIEADPQLLRKLRGVQEWAYESPVDGSGQPFRMVVPTDYAEGDPRGLIVSMHGYGGNHLEHSGGASAHAGGFEIYVLGRARGGWYVGLSQADVLHAIDYVRAYWAIDARRIVLAGGSMGGGATFRLASRFPDRFAAGQITCGYFMQEAPDNLLGVPLYAVHSNDDPIVPLMHAQAVLTRLAERGGPVLTDFTQGYGHASWDFAEGAARSAAWASTQRLPLPNEVRNLDFTALDGAACGAWWARIAEWGPEARPARLQAAALPGNVLRLLTRNVAAISIQLVDTPFDRARPLLLSADGSPPLLVASAPLPAELRLMLHEGRWVRDEAPAPTSRLHTPGGPLTVYDGTPLLIVHGTQGTPEANVRMLAAARAAAKSPRPDWLYDAGDEGVDGVPQWQNLYGHLPVVADSALTDADLASHNLVLIGTAAENSVVARIAAQLPVALDAGQPRCSDGVALTADSRGMLGLVHRNPLAQQQLLFWVAAADARDYEANALVPELGSQFFLGADLLWVNAPSRRLIATRSLGSRWSWLSRPESSPVLSPALAERGALMGAIAECARRHAGADFAVAHLIAGTGPRTVEGGVTRVVDLLPLFYHQAIDTLELTGAELLAAEQKLKGLAEEGSARNWAKLVPSPSARSIDPARRYLVALPTLSVGPFGRATLLCNPTVRRTDLMMDDALERFLARD